MAAHTNLSYCDDSLIETEQISENSEVNLLDAFLDNIYQAYIVFGIPKDELAFITFCIEFLIEKIVNIIKAHASVEIYQAIDKCMVENTKLKFIEDYISTSKNNIIKAGSFYEGTKVGFPDEFDFLFLLCTFKAKSIKNVEKKDYFKKLNEKVNEVLNDQEIKDLLTATCQRLAPGSRLIVPLEDETYEFVTESGPASKLHFIYYPDSSNENNKTDIYVDLVPAFKIISENCNIEQICSVPSFGRLIAQNGSVLIVGKYLAFTETEVHCIRHVFSEKHRKAYKILKFLVQGNKEFRKIYTCGLPNEGLLQIYQWVSNTDGFESSRLETSQRRELKKKLMVWEIIDRSSLEYEQYEMFRISNKCLPSYEIKTAVIKHHFKCRNDRDEQPTQCLLDILQYLCRKYLANGPSHFFASLIGADFTLKKLRKTLSMADFFHYKIKTKQTIAILLNILHESLLTIQHSESMEEIDFVPDPIALIAFVHLYLNKRKFRKYPKHLMEYDPVKLLVGLQKLADPTEIYPDNVDMQKLADPTEIYPDNDNADMQKSADPTETHPNNADMQKSADPTETHPDNADMQKSADPTETHPDNADMQKSADPKKSADPTETHPDNADLQNLADPTELYLDKADMQKLIDPTEIYTDNADILNVAYRTEIHPDKSDIVSFHSSDLTKVDI